MKANKECGKQMDGYHDNDNGDVDDDDDDGVACHV
jgi:hypothetical protein